MTRGIYRRDTKTGAHLLFR